MVITISNSQKTSVINLVSGTVCGYTDSKNILILRLTDADEIREKVGEFAAFVGTPINLTAGKITFHLTPNDVIDNERSISLQFPRGEISWTI